MAFVRDFSLTTVDTNQNSITAGLPGNYQTGDAILVLAIKDTNAGGLGSAPAGWTALAGSPYSKFGLCYGLYIKENVTAGSETDPVFNSTDSDTWSCLAVSIGGVPSSSVVDVALEETHTTLVSTNRRQGITSLTSTADNGLLLRFMSNDAGGSGRFNSCIMGSNDPGIGEMAGFFYRQLGAAGASGVDAWSQGGTGNNASFISVIVKDGSSGADIDPLVIGGGFSGGILMGENNKQYQTVDDTYSLSTSSAAVAYPTVGGRTMSEPRQYRFTGDFDPTGNLPAYRLQADDGEDAGIRFDVDYTRSGVSYDLTGANSFVNGMIFFSSARDESKSHKKDVFPIQLLLEDGSGNWRSWPIFGSDSARRLTTPKDGGFCVDVTSTSIFDESGTLDLSDIRFLAVLMGSKRIMSALFFCSFMWGEPYVLGGGSSNRPINLKFIGDVAYGTGYIAKTTIGTTSQMQLPCIIGDGTVDTYLTLSNETLTWGDGDVDGANNFSDGFLGFELYASAGSFYSITNATITSSTPWRWRQNSTAGSQVYTNNIFSKANPITINTADYSGTKFDICATIAQNGATLTGSTISNSADSIGMIRGTGGAVGATVTGCVTGMKTSIPETIPAMTLDNNTTGILIDAVGSYDVSGVTFTSNTTDIKIQDFTGAVTVVVGDSVVSIDQGTGNTVTIDSSVIVPLTASNIIDDSRAQFYNVTKGVEISNGIVTGGSGYNTNIDINSAAFSVGDIIRLRATYQVGTTAKAELESTGALTASGLSFIDSQVDDDIYNTIGLDGSLITKLAADFVNNEVDLVTASDFEGTELYARCKYFVTLEDGIRKFFGALRAIDIGNYINDVSIIDVYLNNNTSTNLKQIDNARIYKSDGTYPVRNPTTGGGGIDVVWRTNIFVAQTGVSGLTAAESAKLASLDTTNLDAAVSTRSTFNNVSDTVVTDAASRDASKADISLLATEVNATTNRQDLESRQNEMNDGIKKASLLIPHTANLT